ncbi:hypothetical protein ACHAPD_008218 [Fusarium lateritium]
MAIARIRKPDEPPSAAWEIDGANYIDWRGPWADDLKDQECQDCTTTDRTTANAQILQWESLPCWPEDDDSDDPDWMPAEHSQSDNESLEYDSECETSEAASSENGCDGIGYDSLSEEHDGVKDLYPMPELCDQPRPERLPNGTWYNNKIYYTGNRQGPILCDFPGEGEHKVPPEHIASPSCQSLRGINGHRLSFRQMKNCRNVRFLMPKPQNFRVGVDERLMEKDSFFCLSGESNGSNVIEDYYSVGWKSFSPSRHGCRELRIGRVDLDGLWHWREIESRAQADREVLRLHHPDLFRAREWWNLPWYHYTGDEWLVEIPDMRTLLKPCLDVTFAQETSQRQASRLDSIPKELLYQIIDLLSPTDVNSVAKTCHIMYHFTQSRFREIVRKDMAWLWEILEGSQYPESPDRPVNWDPLCPLGIPTPSFPVGLEKEDVEAELWEQIIEEYPEMEEISKAVKTANRKRRDEIVAPYEEKLEYMSQEWLGFRADVETWIRGTQNNTIEVDWGRTWRLFCPETTFLPGLRNRARIWERCQKITGYIEMSRIAGEIDETSPDLLAKLADPSQPGWSTDPEVDGWW